MRQTISVKFFARRDRATEDGLVPVFMRIGLGGKRVNIITKIYVKHADWSVQSGKLKIKVKLQEKRTHHFFSRTLS